jgi:hypothetical protein
MRKRNHYLNIEIATPIGDKAVRARPLQKRMRAGATRWDKDADWYPAAETELRRFTGHTRAAKDNTVDALAWLAFGMMNLMEVEKEDFDPEEEEGFRTRQMVTAGRSAATGY